MQLYTKPRISPSVLSANFLNLQSDIELLNRSESDWIHLDIMDGTFVPNISFGLPVVSSIKKVAQKPLDVHLMIVNPENYIEAFKKAGAAILTVHYEACTHLHRILEVIKMQGLMAGVSINPHTSVQLLDDVLDLADLILVMSVNPGFGGQKFIPNTYSKIEDLKNRIVRKNSKALIEVDGGVDLSNAANLVKAGADVLVSGSFIFNSDNPEETIQKLKNVV